MTNHNWAKSNSSWFVKVCEIFLWLLFFAFRISTHSHASLARVHDQPFYVKSRVCFLLHYTDQGVSIVRERARAQTTIPFQTSPYNFPYCKDFIFLYKVYFLQFSSAMMRQGHKRVLAATNNPINKKPVSFPISPKRFLLRASFHFFSWCIIYIHVCLVSTPTFTQTTTEKNKIIKHGDKNWCSGLNEKAVVIIWKDNSMRDLKMNNETDWNKHTNDNRTRAAWNF